MLMVCRYFSNNDRVMRVHYNTLNLPDSVCFRLQGNTLRMDYMADGRRVGTDRPADKDL